MITLLSKEKKLSEISTDPALDVRGAQRDLTYSSRRIEGLDCDGVRADVHDAPQLEALHGVGNPHLLAPVHGCRLGVGPLKHQTFVYYLLLGQKNTNVGLG